jgi:hypothetical protein
LLASALHTFTLLAKMLLLSSGDMVLPGFFEPELTLFENVEGGVAPYSADGYMFDYALNLLTLQYLRTTNILKDNDRDTALEFMQSSK